MVPNHQSHNLNVYPQDLPERWFSHFPCTEQFPSSGPTHESEDLSSLAFRNSSCSFWSHGAPFCFASFIGPLTALDVLGWLKDWWLKNEYFCQLVSAASELIQENSFTDEFILWWSTEELIFLIPFGKCLDKKSAVTLGIHISWAKFWTDNSSSWLFSEVTQEVTDTDTCELHTYSCIN